jgi:hypothetical protein
MLRLLLVALLVTNAAASVDVSGGVPRTARAVRAAVKKHQLKGDVWLGKLRGVGGGRDTLVYIPKTIDPERTIELVIYMEGIGSFADASMDTRHAASIKRLRGNFVYVAPDSPSSSLGVRDANTEHWEAGCAEHVCEGGAAAPGDFLVFLDEVRAKIANATGGDRLDLRVSLIGFSRGGKGVVAALEQLQAVGFEVAGTPVRLGTIVFADGNYLENALTRSWEILAPRPEAPQLTILVGAGEFKEVGGDDNRRRALLFWREAAPEAAEPTATHAAEAPRLRIVPLRGGHFAIGDTAVDFLRRADAVARAS